MKTIAIVATGGTIAGTGQLGKAAHYRAGEISVDQIIESIPLIKEVAHIKEYELMSIDSNEMNIPRWIELANQINEIVKDETIDGVVVTHGTDTLDETAYFLTLTLNTTKPVVLTGAMRPATATSADGPFNLYQAVCLATHHEAHHQGVMALFSNTIFSGRDIQKINNYKIDAFDQRAFSCLGYMQDHEAYFFSRTFKIHTLASRFSKDVLNQLPEVAIGYFYAGASSQILYDMAKYHQGIVIAGSGNGNYSQSWLHAIEDLSKQGILFVRASRVNEGIIFDDAIFDPHHYCIAANTLSAQKARVLLMLALSQTKDKKEIVGIFNEY
ncbi:MAG: asparaginase [Coprobacillus sp.]